MPQATALYRNRIALIFDFDSTLGPSTFHTMLSKVGIDPDKFEDERVQPLVDDGWETILARYYCLIQESQQREEPITHELMQQVGEEFELFENVENMFGLVREWAREVIDDVEVEFYMLTAGTEEIPMATKIADEFDQIWAGELSFNDQNEVDFVKRIITHPEKNRYLTQLAKGFHLDGDVQPSNVYREIDLQDYYIPFDQMIYIGDGASDMPAFSLMKEKDGIAIGVVVADSVDDWRGYDEIHSERRVQNIAPADYHEDSELMQSIRHAVRSITEKIALRSLSQGE